MPEAQEKLVSALSEFVRIEAGKPATDEDEGGIGRATLVTLLAFATLAAVLLWLFEGVVKHPAFALLEKLVPAVLGAAFIAKTKRVREILVRLCDQAWFRTATALGLVSALVLASWPFEVPLVIGKRSLVRIDDRDVRILPPRTPNGPNWIAVKGFRPHTLNVEERATDNALRAGSFQLTRHDLLASMWQQVRRRAGALEVQGLVALAPTPLLVNTEGRAETIIVRGHFPTLFLRSERRIRNVAGDAIWYRVSANRQSSGLSLPAGEYDFRYIGEDGCETPWHRWKVRHLVSDAASMLDLSEDPCVPPTTASARR